MNMQSTRFSLLAFSLVFAAPFALAPALTACGSDSSSNGPGPVTTASMMPSATTSATATATTLATGPRKLIAGPLLPSSPGNLLLDPTFGQLTSQDASYGSFLAYYSDTNATFTATTTLDSRSPAGFSGNVAVVAPAAATDTVSRGIVMLASVLGGTGPYHASIYASKSNAAGAPADFTPASNALAISLATDFDDGPASMNAKVYALVPDANPTKSTNGRTWYHYQVDVTDPLPSGAFFLVQTGTKGGGFELAAPAVTSAALEKEISTEARVLVSARAMRDDERAIIRKYKATPLKYRRPEVQKIRGE